jgi:hypothetical protein
MRFGKAVTAEALTEACGCRGTASEAIRNSFASSNGLPRTRKSKSPVRRAVQNETTLHPLIEHIPLYTDV